MRILVVNDDGIDADGIIKLAELALGLGEVWVVAPEEQCSAMSHRITVFGELKVKKVEFPIEKVKAYSVSGTPADCVKVALHFLMKEHPDIILSGINKGYNVGLDILYSGTVGAAMEGILNGIPSIAYSRSTGGDFGLIDKYLIPITEKLLLEKIEKNEIWNVNFPGCGLEKFAGIRENTTIDKNQFYLNHYVRADLENGDLSLTAGSIREEKVEVGSDKEAVLNHCISIGKYRNPILGI